jgi:hypothetical protein
LILIRAHRDTHFAFLPDLSKENLLEPMNQTAATGVVNSALVKPVARQCPIDAIWQEIL